MSEILDAFDHGAVSKRKRDVDDFDREDRTPKRRHAFSLPMRTPPRQKPSISINSTLGISAPGTLTPIDTSEDESFNEDVWFTRLPSRTDSQPNSEGSDSSIKVQVSDRDQDMEDIAMSFSPPPPSHPRIGRARSNDLISPPRPASPNRRVNQPHLLDPGPNTLPVSDRLPTPTIGHFNIPDARLTALSSAAPKHHFPSLRTNLSPMIEQDTWGRIPHSLPSPEEEPDSSLPTCDDVDVMMSFEETSQVMSGLKVSDSNDDPEPEHPIRRHGQGFDGHSSQGHQRQSSHARSARLHMGFLAGCDKCQQKVPGHYSHILWS